jgi:hypothetical protein
MSAIRNLRPAAATWRGRWLLWLVLALPLAQSVLAWHAYAHRWAPQQGWPAAAGAAFETPGSGGQIPPAHVPCELCLAGAAVDAGWLAASPLALPWTTAGHALALIPQHTGHVAPAPNPYQSRAPPVASR